jgi:hypothetical protein
VSEASRTAGDPALALDPAQAQAGAVAQGYEPATADQVNRVDQVLRVATGLGVLSGIEIRVLPVVRADFPLNDGGLLAVLIGDLQRADFVLPSLSSYRGQPDGAGVPFVQSPLPLYLTAFVTQLGPVDVTGMLRFLPVLVTLLTLPAFWWLARAFLGSRAGVTIAFVAFAALPAAYQPLITGGGLARAPAMVFALLALRYLVVMVQEGTLRQVLMVGMLGALALLCDAAAGWFLAISLGIFALASRARPTAREDALLAGLVSVLATAPWWMNRVLLHGLGPLAAPWWSGPVAFTALRLPLPFSILAVGGVLSGLALSVRLAASGDRQAGILAWLLALALLDPAVVLHSAPVLCLGLGLLVGDELLSPLRSHRFPPLRSLLRLLLPPTAARAPAAGEAASGRTPGDAEPAAGLPGLLDLNGRAPVSTAGGGHRQILRNLGTLLLLIAFGTIASARSWRTDQAGLQPLSAPERVALRAAADTPAAATFLVISGDPATGDRAGEWFPALAERTNLVSPQALPWGAGGTFASRIEAHTQAQRCGRQDTLCLDQWEQAGRVSFTHVYVARRPDRTCCDPLRAALRADDRYTVVYDGPGATIFARVAEESQ